MHDKLHVIIYYLVVFIATILSSYETIISANGFYFVMRTQEVFSNFLSQVVVEAPSFLQNALEVSIYFLCVA
jgi:hypothetical protein